MTRSTLIDLSGRNFDVAVVGAGIVGCTAARELAAAGYQVLVVDRCDFASGATARSSRFLANGLRYLSVGGSMRGLLKRPRELLTALSMARQAMRARSRFVRRAPKRVRPLNMVYPLDPDGPYSAGQLRMAFAVLRMLDPFGETLGVRQLSRESALTTPLLQWVRGAERLQGAVVYREYQIDWPERVALDALMDAQRLGAVIRNYTSVIGLDREEEDRWRLRLTETKDDPSMSSIAVTASLVLNTAGPWVDLVNRTTAREPTQLVAWTKGAHIVVRLPGECQPWGLAFLASNGRPLSITPWRDLHFIGPTETPFDGDPDDIRVTDEDVEFLLGEAARQIPGAGLRREHVLSGWAGVRPLTWSANTQSARRDCVIRDLADEGLPGILAVTGAPLATHEFTAAALAGAVASQLRPSQRKGEVSRIDAEVDPVMTPENVRRSVEVEQALSVADLLLRRLGLGWNETMGAELAHEAAYLLGESLGWRPDRVEKAAAEYLAELQRTYGVRKPAATSSPGL